jgi:DNA-binding MarR family transcriptional regulator
MRKREPAEPRPLATSAARTFTSGGARRFFQICTTAAAEATLAENLTPLQGGVLAYLNKVDGEPDIDQIGLAARMGIDRARASQLVDELEARGIVERRINGADRRARLLRLTPRGEKLRAQVHPKSYAAAMSAFASLTVEERELLFDLLIRVIESNPALARPGSGRRKRGFRQSLPNNRSRPSRSNQH